MTRYELLDRIGVGGMAEIFRGKAVAAGGFEKPVAIKRILPHLSQDSRFVELLIAEAKVLSLLKHRNIVQIFDVGLGDDGQYFLVMEYVDGKDVGAIQRSLENQRRRVPYDLVLHIGAEICEALEHAHNSRGPDGRPMRLVHRDVSPSNVILSRAGEVKLTDFGIAKRAEAETTRGGAVRGKFAYISPEQARNEHLDPRSDVFSVGILLWELFCNRRLFSALPDLEALRGVRDAHIPPPTQADPRLPKGIDSVMMTALARDKARRFASAGEFGAQLRAMRYALDVTVGDPASEIARIVESAIQDEQRAAAPIPPSGPRDFDVSDATVIRIHTADKFSDRESNDGLVAARQVIDRFEDEETRLASLSGDQLRILRDPGAPANARPKRTRAPSDEATRAREPLSPEEIAALGDVNAHLTPTDETKLVTAPRDRRTPPPQQRVRQASDAPLTLDDQPDEPWRTAPTAPTNNNAAPLTLDEPPSRSASRSVSRSVSHSVSHAAAPMTLEGATPPSLAAAAAAAAQPAAPQLPSPPQLPAPPQLPMPAPMPQPAPLPQPAPMPQPPPNAGFVGWGPPIAAQQQIARAAAPPPPPPAPPATSPGASSGTAPPAPRRPPTRPPSTLGGSYSTQTTLGFRPWMLVVGAVIVALAAFAITRAFIR